MTNMPIATDWLLTAAESSNHPAIKSVYLVYSNKTQKKGTAFALTSGLLITNEHVVKGSNANDMVAVSSEGQKNNVKRLVVDDNRDLAALEFEVTPSEGLKIQKLPPSIGAKVHTWGYPLAYNGPSPILSVGYLAGFNPVKKKEESEVVKRYVINGAFNPGNSGGPLFDQSEDAVIGVVVAKHAPISALHLSAIEALKRQGSGFQYTATAPNGQQIKFSEGQLVGELLQYFRNITQVVIGEAIASTELIDFLSEHGIAYETL